MDGLKDGSSNIECNDDESWTEGYLQGLYDGYQERKKDEEAGAPDQYEDYDNWFHFWTGEWPKDVRFD